MYQSSEATASTRRTERRGRVLRKQSQIRRGLQSSSTSYYSIEYEDRDKDSGRIVQSGREVVDEIFMEFPSENRERKMRAAFERMFLGALRRGFALWWAKVCDFLGVLMKRVD